MADDLFDLRNAVTLGNFHQAIAEGSQIKVTGRKAEDIVDIHAERDLLIARAQVGLGQHDAVIAEHRSASHALLKLAHAWAAFHRAQLKHDTSDADAAFKQLAAVAGEKPSAGVPATAAVLAAACHLYRDEVAKAVQLCGTWAAALEAGTSGAGQPQQTVTRQSLELRAVLVEALLRMHRADFADKALQDMRKLDDDSVLTMLAGISVAIAQSGGAAADKIAEARGLLQDLGARCGQSTSLLNISAVTALLSGKPSECEASLVASLGKRSNDTDTLSNLAALAATLGKPAEAFQRLSAQATASSADAVWPKQFAAAQQRFRDSASAFVAAV